LPTGALCADLKGVPVLSRILDLADLHRAPWATMDGEEEVWRPMPHKGERWAAAACDCRLVQVIDNARFGTPMCKSQLLLLH
jgi:hypothetical protein